MLRKLTLIISTIFLSHLLAGQTCPILNENGSFEETIFVPGGEPTIGITTGQIQNWYATHGTVDYVTEDWNWYDVEGVTSIAAHMCYGHRDSHDHSEGMYTAVDIHGDDDLLYTLSLDYATVCESTENGFLNIALNSNLEAGGHNGFQYPTPELFPEVFQEIQLVDRMELMPATNMETSGISNYEISFVPENDFEQIWMFTEYQHEQDEFINCGLILDNIKLTATTSALTGINVQEVLGDNFQLTPEFSKELEVVSYSWTVNHVAAGNEEELIYNFTDNVYTICLDIIDSRGACGSICHELDLTSTQEEDTDPTSCTYSACLDSNGLPNIVSFEYLASNGDIVVLNETTDGFFFPYCNGSPSMCDGGESEVDLFIEDLNAYFSNQGIDATATTGDGAGVFEVACRSLALTIVSSEIMPAAILIDDFSMDQVFITVAEFEFDPNDCGSSIAEENTELYAFSSDDADNEDESIRSILKPVVLGGTLIIEENENAKGTGEVMPEKAIISKVGIYTIGGQKIASVDDFKNGDEINIDYLPTGTYAINLVNAKEQKAGFFFVGDIQH